jgi:hypothetical protein
MVAHIKSVAFEEGWASYPYRISLDILRSTQALKPHHIENAMNMSMLPGLRP